MTHTMRTARWCSALLALAFAARADAGEDLRLIEAARSRDRAAVQALLKQRVDVNAPSPDGSTALLWAVRRDDATIVDLLIHAGASVETANEYGITPLWVAARNGNAAEITALLRAGAKPDGRRLT